MFLYVYVFILLSILGLFTNVFMLRASRMADDQKGVAEVMMVWHSAAYRTAKTTPFTPPAATGCMMTNGSLYVPSTAQPACTTLVAQGNLPAEYNYADTGMRFLSKAYRSGGVNYLVTYVENGMNVLGYNAQQIYAQMRNAKFPPVSYGSVRYAAVCNGAAPANLIVTTERFVGGVNFQVCYPASNGAGVNFLPDGTVAIVSVLGS